LKSVFLKAFQLKRKLLLPDKSDQMDKLSKSLKALSMIVRKPYLLNLILEDNNQWNSYLIKNHPGVDRLPQLSFNDLFGSLDETISPFTFLDGGSLPTDLALLKGLARQIEHCNYFEIGTWRGESVANVSPIANVCYTMDLPDDEKRMLGMNEEYIRQHAILSKNLSNVNHLKANSLSFDFSALGKKFDLVFIDGDHHYKGVRNDTLKVVSHLIHEHSIIVWHDYAYNPEKVRYEVFAAILDGLPADYHQRLFHVANTICAIYLPIPVKITGNPLKAFEVNIKCR
jgi:predicted O-methyltransferase YrrM